ncbi:DoxX family protein [Salinicola rhizosphaerae]|uniref:GntR family transcriptional regulator n=1 Tax=Salinicola rhizosphaerae TaxID=1443141 RepID=A0ABQ3E308_9GAMM|nr:DoxX family protein [Salinicola rhizosphaerae]GHB22098.1 GntR family transcriptional regulator [Salinicola rhizosphaerae]
MMRQLLQQDDLGKLILRLGVGCLILLHGINKIAHPAAFDWLGQTLAAHGLPSFIAYGVLLGEVVGPLMVIVGWQSRIGGLLMAGNMIVAVALVHLPQFGLLTEQGGWMLELQAMYLLGALVVMFLGSGRFAVKPD